MRLLILSRYGRLGASSRLRSYQYIAHLAAAGIDVRIEPLLGDDYVAGLYAGRVPALSVLKSYGARIAAIRGAARHDVVWVEKEMLPWLPAGIEFGLVPAGVPIIVDFDDATFHRYDMHPSRLVRTLLGRKIDAVMRRANIVVVGNGYIAERARAAGARRVEQVPTVVDVDRYRPAGAWNPERPPVVGWIGNPATAKYLHQLATPLRRITGGGRARAVAVGANPAQIADLPIEARPWTEATEAAEVQEFDVGIMPLPDEPFERGKCGYKLIQYMACGKPVVASPVGVNATIVEHGVNGFLCESTAQWEAALRQLIEQPGLRARMGAAGRARVVASYSLAVTAPHVEALVRSAAG